MDLKFLDSLIERGDVIGFVAALVASLFAVWLKFRTPTAPREPSSDGDQSVDQLKDVASKIGDIDRRLSKVEGSVDHLPTRDEFHSIEMGYVRLSERMKSVEKTTTSTGRAVSRIEDFLLNLGRN